MKKIVLFFALVLVANTQAQESKQMPMITVSGEGKIKVAPDQVLISISIETKGSKADDVKKENDKKMDAILRFVKKSNLAPEDVQTQRISLNPNFDYEKKKYSYQALQSLQILIKDLSKYDSLMEGLINEGINRIENVEFKSSKKALLESEARKLAMKDAKTKADDYVLVLGQKVGKAIVISDNSQIVFPQPRMYAMKASESDAASSRETLAIGEIEISANVNVSFSLD